MWVYYSLYGENIQIYIHIYVCLIIYFHIIKSYILCLAGIMSRVLTQLCADYKDLKGTGASKGHKTAHSSETLVHDVPVETI